MLVDSLMSVQSFAGLAAETPGELALGFVGWVLEFCLAGSSSHLGRVVGNAAFIFRFIDGFTACVT